MSNDPVTSDFRIAKERDRDRFGSGGGGFDDDKFMGNWRREGPLPSSEPLPRGGPRGGSGFGFRDGPAAGDDEGPRRGARFTTSTDTDRERERPELNGDWRNSRGPMPPPPEREREVRRGFGALESSGAADAEETWTKGSKFRPSPSGSDSGSVGRKFGSGFTERSGTGTGSGTATPAVAEEGDWRSRARPALSTQRQSSFEQSRKHASVFAQNEWTNFFNSSNQLHAPYPTTGPQETRVASTLRSNFDCPHSAFLPFSGLNLSCRI